MIAAHFAPVPHAALASKCEALIADSSGKFQGAAGKNFPLASWIRSDRREAFPRRQRAESPIQPLSSQQASRRSALWETETARQAFASLDRTIGSSTHNPVMRYGACFTCKEKRETNDELMAVLVTHLDALYRAITRVRT
jgi:hypothetical protein